jgi:hypothetical protein
MNTLKAFMLLFALIGFTCQAWATPPGYTQSGYTGCTTDGSNGITCTGNVAASNLPSAVVGTTDTQTLTNKRITKRIQTAADATSITPTGDTADVVKQTNSQSVGTLTINNPTGSPTDGQTLTIRIKCGANVQTYAFDTLYRGSTTTALPTVCTASKSDYILFMYNSTDTKWDILAYSTGQ